MTPKLSVIIPTLNEEQHLDSLLTYLKYNISESEIIVCDGGSTDKTIEIAIKHDVHLFRTSTGRALQMNTGAKKARGEALYFLHADTFPPLNFETLIINALQKSNAGSFRMQFNSDNRLLRIYALFTRFNWRICRGGDRSLFLTKSLFEEIGGYPDLSLLEDYVLFKLALQKGKFASLNEEVVTSDRKYKKYGVIRLQLVYGYIHLLWWFGVTEEKLHELIKKILKD